MQSLILRRRGHSLAAFTMLLGIVIPVVTFATPGDHSTGQQHDHVCIMPTMQPDSSSSCAQEAAAYAAAIVALEDARRVATEAYQRWYQCEYQGQGGKPSVDIPSAEYSVLVRE